MFESKRKRNRDQRVYRSKRGTTQQREDSWGPEIGLGRAYGPIRHPLTPDPMRFCLPLGPFWPTSDPPPRILPTKPPEKIRTRSGRQRHRDLPGIVGPCPWNAILPLSFLFLGKSFYGTSPSFTFSLCGTVAVIIIAASRFLSYDMTSNFSPPQW